MPIAPIMEGPTRFMGFSCFHPVESCCLLRGLCSFHQFEPIRAWVWRQWRERRQI